MEAQDMSKRTFKRAFCMALAVISLLGGYRFKESLASLEAAGVALLNSDSQDKTNKQIVRLSQTPSFSRFDLYIWESASTAGLDPNLWKAVIMTESAGNEMAISPKGAMGLCQLMPHTARSLGLHHEQSFDPEANLRAGAAYMTSLMVRFGGKTELALAAYNAGPEAVRRHGGIPSYQETQKYVRSIMALYRWLQSNPDSWAQARPEIAPAAALIPPQLQIASTFRLR